jgi:predicted SAM-dependent methyltransferase
MKIHLGCGTNYIKGWVNVDLDSPLADAHLDLRCPLPYADASVNFIFNEHFIEHVTREEGFAFLKECRRF